MPENTQLYLPKILYHHNTFVETHVILVIHLSMSLIILKNISNNLLRIIGKTVLLSVYSDTSFVLYLGHQGNCTVVEASQKLFLL